VTVDFMKEKQVSSDISRQQHILEDMEINVSTEDIKKMRNHLLLSKKDFTILETIHPKKKGRLASMHKAMLRGEEVVCRIITNDRINNFIIEGFLETVCRLK
jgi:ribosomal protein S15P/S13E